MSQTPTIILIPIDNRPITYGFPQLIAANAGLKVATAPSHLIGSQHAPPSLAKLSEWLEQSLSTIKPQALFVCLDSILYGGLVASRRSPDSLTEVMKRLSQIANWKKLAGNSVKIYAQASIARIPHYNASSTEPDYWQDYGEKIFRWSVLKHKLVLGLLNDTAALEVSEREIPDHILAEFTSRRQRNFQANQSLIEIAKKGEIDYLVFSQDDTAEFGLNVWEKSQLMDLAKQAGATNITSYAGTDEVIMTLMARWFSEAANRSPRVSIHFSPEDGKQVISNFEGQTIAASLAAQIKAANLKPIDKVHSPNDGGVSPSVNMPKIDQDFAVVVHTGGILQGDHIALSKDSPAQSLDNNNAVETTIRLLDTLPAPIVLCDVAYANGSDPLLIEKMLPRKDLIRKLSTYAGWNTTGNTIGSALALGTAHWYAELTGASTKEASQHAFYIRLADDWAYQAQVRAQLAGQASEEQLRILMDPYLQRLANALEFDPGSVNLKLPWRRTFEVEIDLGCSKTLINSR